MDRCECGREIVQPKTGRPRRRCETCSPTKARNRIVPIKAPGSRPDPTIADVVREAIVQAGKAGTPDGVAAIFAAEMLAAGGMTGPAAAALLREMRAASGDALRDVAEAGDIVDDLKKRRAKRRSG